MVIAREHLRKHAQHLGQVSRGVVELRLLEINVGEEVQLTDKGGLLAGTGQAGAGVGWP